MSRICIIGDVHGMTDLLQQLLMKLDLSEGDTLVSLDLWANAPFKTILIEANHEDRHLRYQRNLTERPKVARKMAEATARLPELDAALSEQDRAFLNSAVLFWRVPAHGIICVHGGFPGNMNELPVDPTDIEQMAKKDQNWYRQILRTRFISAETGKFLSLGKEQDGDPFWAEAYDGRFGHAVFGHQPFFDGPAEFPHATGIDTGAVDGGSLTALILQADGDRSYESVAAEYPGRSPQKANAPLR